MSRLLHRANRASPPLAPEQGLLPRPQEQDHHWHHRGTPPDLIQISRIMCKKSYSYIDNVFLVIIKSLLHMGPRPACSVLLNFKTITNNLFCVYLIITC